MMSFLVCDPCHGVDEGHGFVEALEIKAAVDFCAVVIGLPAGHLRQQTLDLFLVQRTGAAFTGYASFFGQVFGHVQAALSGLGGYVGSNWPRARALRISERASAW